MSTIGEKFWSTKIDVLERREETRKEFTLTDAQIDAVDDTAGLPPVNRAGKERANEHAWNNQF